MDIYIYIYILYIYIYIYTYLYISHINFPAIISPLKPY